MIKVCGVLKRAELREVGTDQIVKLQIIDPAGGDYAPTHNVDDWQCRNWKELQGQEVEIPCSARANKGYLNFNPLDSVQVAHCAVKK